MRILRESPWGGGGGSSFIHIPAPKSCSQSLTSVDTVVYFFPFNGCLVSRGSFGFVFVWILVLSFTYAMSELIFFVGSRLFSVRFFSECVEFPLSLFPVRSGILHL